MSNIEYGNVKILWIDYKEILEKKIVDVCRKIDFDDLKITWIIYEPNNISSDKIKNVLIGRAGRDYGYCKPSENKVWISTLAISKDISRHSLTPQFFPIVSSKIQKDFLADVIIDEITHIQTGCNHGCKKYEDKLSANRKRYYTGV